MIISIIVPCRNEEKFIVPFLNNVFSQKLSHGYCCEVLIADGMSTDRTRELIAEYRISHPNRKIILIENKNKIVSTGLNLAITGASGEIIVRMDVHTEYDETYILTCVNVLLASKADNVGGPWRAYGKNFVQRGIAAAFQSPVSCGGARSHDLNYRGAADSVYLGCWHKQKLIELEMFDETLVRNQDDELNYRIIKNGGLVFQDPSITSYYYPRSSLLALFFQYMQYGYWKVKVIQKHNFPASLRHVIPTVFVFATIILGLTAFFSSNVRWLLSVTELVYIGTLACGTILSAEVRRNPLLFVITFVSIAVMHIGYGYGFARGLWDFLILRVVKNENFASLTR